MNGLGRDGLAHPLSTDARVLSALVASHRFDLNGKFAWRKLEARCTCSVDIDSDSKRIARLRRLVP
jgi:hypothetical protein